MWLVPFELLIVFMIHFLLKCSHSGYLTLCFKKVAQSFHKPAIFSGVNRETIVEKKNPSACASKSHLKNAYIYKHYTTIKHYSIIIYINIMLYSTGTSLFKLALILY